jgi:hypothetical protein
MASEREFSLKRLSEDPWLVLYHPIPQDADAELLKAARAAAVLCRTESELLSTHDAQDPHAPDLKKIDAILTDIRKRLGEPEPEPKSVEPGMKATLDELEAKWKAQPHKQHDRKHQR